MLKAPFFIKRKNVFLFKINTDKRKINGKKLIKGEITYERQNKKYFFQANN